MTKGLMMILALVSTYFSISHINSHFFSLLVGNAIINAQVVVIQEKPTTVIGEPDVKIYPTECYLQMA
jgi:hypothetical protein